jgi:hypothetical protein
VIGAVNPLVVGATPVYNTFVYAVIEGGVYVTLGPTGPTGATPPPPDVTDKLNVAVPTPLGPVPVTVYSRREEISIVLPVISPVNELKFKPAGKLPPTVIVYVFILPTPLVTVGLIPVGE